MRLIVLSLTAACGIAFCQDNSSQLQLNDNLYQHLGKMYQVQRLQTAANAAPSQLMTSSLTWAPKICSIPLLNATAPGKPVPMPKVQPRDSTQKLDRIDVVDPAPACPTKFAGNAAPAPKP